MARTVKFDFPIVVPLAFEIDKVSLLSALDDDLVVSLSLEHSKLDEIELLGREPAQLLAVRLAIVRHDLA